MAGSGSDDPAGLLVCALGDGQSSDRLYSEVGEYPCSAGNDAEAAGEYACAAGDCAAAAGEYGGVTGDDADATFSFLSSSGRRARGTGAGVPYGTLAAGLSWIRFIAAARFCSSTDIFCGCSTSIGAAGAEAGAGAGAGAEAGAGAGAGAGADADACGAICAACTGGRDCLPEPGAIFASNALRSGA